jgi:hypothetical protein
MKPHITEVPAPVADIVAALALLRAALSGATRSEVQWAFGIAAGEFNAILRRLRGVPAGEKDSPLELVRIANDQVTPGV